MTEMIDRDDSLTIAAKVGAIFKRDAALAISYEANFVVQWASVISQVVIIYFIASMVPPSPRFGFAGQSGTFFSYAIVNLAFVTLQTTALSSFSKTVRDGQLQGTLEVVLSTPTSLPIVVLSGGLWAFALTAATSLGMLVLGVLLGLNMTHTNVLTLAVFIVLTLLALSPLGVLSAAATMVFKQTAPFDFAVSTLSYMFGGVYIPLALLPHALAPIGWFLPITHALNGIRAAISGASIGQVLGDAIWLLVAIAILTPVSLLVFGRAVAHAKRDGTLAGH